MSDKDDTIFSNTEVTETTSDKEVESTVLQGIVNVDGSPKYSDIDTALKSIQPAQAHIEKLEAELSELRNKEHTSVEDVLKAVRKETEVTTSQAPPDIAEITRQTVREMKQQDEAVANQRKVAASLRKVYGDKAEEEYLKKAQDLSLGPDTMNELAGRSPNAVLSWFDNATKVPPTTHSTSVERTNLERNIKEPQQIKSVMGFSSTEEVLTAWKAAAPQAT